MQCDDGIASECVRDAIAVEGDGGESTGVDTICNEPHTALVFQPMKLVRDGAAIFVFPVAVAELPDCGQGSRLGVLGEGNLRIHSILI